MSDVDIDGVSKRYGETVALQNIDVAIRDGEFFSLVGPSGCGKTTTLRLLAGFEAPTDGVIRFAGESVSGVPPEDRDVGIVFQNYALFPTMSVRENIAYGLQFRDPPNGESVSDRVGSLLTLVDLEGMGDRDPVALSGGQQQRVALARALAPGPSVLLLDEPMSALDARLRQELRVQVSAIQSELDITTVYVTHDQAEALAISDRVAVMNDGRIEQVAAPETVYQKPASRFVASFIGENNLFDGTVSATDPPVLDVGEGTIPLPSDAAVNVGDSVTVCIRPESLRIADDSATFDVSVNYVEFLGDAYRLHCEWGETELIVKTAEPAEGMVSLAVDRSAVHRVP